MWEPHNSDTLALERGTFKKAKAERFLVRTKKAINTQLFSVLRAAQRLLLMAKHQIINSAYAIQRTLFIQALKEFVTWYAQLTFS